MANETQNTKHVPAPGKGQGFRWASVCGVPMTTITGDVTPMQKEAAAIAIGAKKDDGIYCADCLLALAVANFVVEETPETPTRHRSYAVYAPRTTPEKIKSGEAKALILSRRKPSKTDFAVALKNMLGWRTR